MERVWSDSVGEEKNLADNISTLRKALGDDPKEPRYIKTVQRRGYRFVADEKRVEEESLIAERARMRMAIEEDDPHSF